MNAPDPRQLAGIRFLLTDVDGVLTDGRIHFDPSGREYKTFHVHDGAGLAYWHRSGGLSGFLSGRAGEVVAQRAEELGVHEVLLGQVDKRKALDGILERRGLAPEQVAYIGDDLLDLPVLGTVGFAVAPANARPEVLDRVHHVTDTRAGCGVLRETVELLLRARGAWDEVVRKCGLP
jgi:3-deoxy-D-manno-octulosonate 8-phosphate phosphatase (KDO 8-P phosphatase)